MTGFEPQNSRIRSDRSTNWATTTALSFLYLSFRLLMDSFFLRCCGLNKEPIVLRNFSVFLGYATLLLAFWLAEKLIQSIRTFKNWAFCKFILKCLYRIRPSVALMISAIEAIAYTVHCNVTRLGYFWKVLETYSLTK